MNGINGVDERFTKLQLLTEMLLLEMHMSQQFKRKEQPKE